MTISIIMSHLAPRNFLVIPSGNRDQRLIRLMREFCGKVITLSHICEIPQDATVYCCISPEVILSQIGDTPSRILVVREFYDGEMPSIYPMVDLERLPIHVNGFGVYFRKFFNEEDIFSRVGREHTFQTLRESNKPSNALRKGVYLSEMEENGRYYLMRCSSNFSGPTEIFGETDRQIVSLLNIEAPYLFNNPPTFNHVLAQIYLNDGRKKARISPHSDKTEDMAPNAMIAFCTFYDHIPVDLDENYEYKGVSALTQLHFRPKTPDLDEFSVTLFPNSVFIIPLSTNRLYTHEIRPSGLDSSLIPTRMGYVVRCSSTVALYRDGQTYIEENSELIPLALPKERDIEYLRSMYLKENTSTDEIEYMPIYFSMNHGDYLEPIP